MLTNWKTTSAGITAIVGAITGLTFAIKAHNITPEIISAVTTGILLGVGLIFSKDHDVTGGSVQQ